MSSADYTALAKILDKYFFTSFESAKPVSSVDLLEGLVDALLVLTSASCAEIMESPAERIFRRFLMALSCESRRRGGVR